MSMGKTIRSNAKSIVLAAVVAGAAVGCCKEYKEYTYDGKIGQEQVKFVANYNFFRDFESHKSLEVTRTNGTKVTYLADGHKDTFDINTIIINKAGKETTYGANDIIGKEVIQEGQIQFTNYLAKILELKRSESLADIKIRE